MEQLRILLGRKSESVSAKSGLEAKQEGAEGEKSRTFSKKPKECAPSNIIRSVSEFSCDGAFADEIARGESVRMRHSPAG